MLCAQAHGKEGTEGARFFGERAEKAQSAKKPFALSAGSGGVVFIQAVSKKVREDTVMELGTQDFLQKRLLYLESEEYTMTGALNEVPPDMLDFLYINVVWFLAGFVNGVTSFGGNLVAVPLMTLVMDAKTAIILGCLVGLGITLPIAVCYHRELPRLEFMLSCLGSVAGIPLGIVILKAAPARVILLACGSILLLFLFWQFVSGRMHGSFRIPLWCIVPMSVVAGILLGATSMGGPILAMYAVMRGWNKEVTLSMLNTLAALVLICLIPAQGWSGLYTPEILHMALWAIPCAVAGVLMSIPVIRRLNARVFRVLVLAMLAFSTVMLFVKGLTA